MCFYEEMSVKSQHFSQEAVDWDNCLHCHFAALLQDNFFSNKSYYPFFMEPVFNLRSLKLVFFYAVYKIHTGEKSDVFGSGESSVSIGSL